MYSVRRFFIILAPAFIIATSLFSSAFSQGLKIGYIDDEKVKQSYPEWARAADQWGIEQKAWDEEAANKQQELKDLMDEYDKQKLILSEEKRKEREAEIRTKSESLDAFTRQIYGPGGTAERKQMELIGPLLDNVNKAIEVVALEGDYDVIFTSQSGIGYIKDIYDVTDKVLEQLDKLEK